VRLSSMTSSSSPILLPEGSTTLVPSTFFARMAEVWPVAVGISLSSPLCEIGSCATRRGAIGSIMDGRSRPQQIRLPTARALVRAFGGLQRKHYAIVLTFLCVPMGAPISHFLKQFAGVKAAPTETMKTPKGLQPL